MGSKDLVPRECFEHRCTGRHLQTLAHVSTQADIFQPLTLSGQRRFALVEDYWLT